MARKVLSLGFIFLAFYLGAHFWIRARNTVTDDVTKISRLVGCHPADVRGVKITQQEGGRSRELVFERLDQPDSGIPQSTQLARSIWAFRGPFAGEADAARLKRIASAFCELYDPVPVRGSDLPPVSSERLRAARIEIRLERGGRAEKHILEFGPEQEGRMNIVAYQEEGGARALLRIPVLLEQAASLPAEEYRNLKVMRLEADNVSAATLKVGGKERFTIERAGADWALRRGGRDLGMASAEAEKFVNRLASLRGIGIDDPVFPAEKCGAESADTVVELHGVAGRNEVVRFRYGGTGNISACSTSGTMRFKVHKEMAKYLDLDARSLAPARN